MGIKRVLEKAGGQKGLELMLGPRACLVARQWIAEKTIPEIWHQMLVDMFARNGKKLTLEDCQDGSDG